MQSILEIQIMFEKLSCYLTSEVNNIFHNVFNEDLLKDEDESHPSQQKQKEELNIIVELTKLVKERIDLIPTLIHSILEIQEQIEASDIFEPNSEEIKTVKKYNSVLENHYIFQYKCLNLEEGFSLPNCDIPQSLILHDFEKFLLEVKLILDKDNQQSLKNQQIVIKKKQEHKFINNQFQQLKKLRSLDKMVNPILVSFKENERNENLKLQIALIVNDDIFDKFLEISEKVKAIENSDEQFFKELELLQKMMMQELDDSEVEVKYTFKALKISNYNTVGLQYIKNIFQMPKEKELVLYNNRLAIVKVTPDNETRIKNNLLLSEKDENNYKIKRHLMQDEITQLDLLEDKQSILIKTAKKQQTFKFQGDNEAPLFQKKLKECQTIYKTVYNTYNLSKKHIVTEI